VRAISVIKVLLQHGALVSARDYRGQTPLHIAAHDNNIVGATMLIEAGANVMPHDDKGKTPLDYAESAEMIKLLTKGSRR
jgi:ankyrin repeat protein